MKEADEKHGRGAAGKDRFLAAVALNEQCHPVKMRMTVVKGFRTRVVKQWGKQHLAPGSMVISDKLACFSALNDADCNQI